MDIDTSLLLTHTYTFTITGHTWPGVLWDTELREYLCRLPARSSEKRCHGIYPRNQTHVRTTFLDILLPAPLFYKPLNSLHTLCVGKYSELCIPIWGGIGQCEFHASFSNQRDVIRGGADKSLARPTSWCRRTESIVSLERGICSCAELHVFYSYRGWKEACRAQRAISTTSRRELSSSFPFPARQDAEGNSRHSERNVRGTCTIVCHCQKLGGPV